MFFSQAEIGFLRLRQMGVGIAGPFLLLSSQCLSQCLVSPGFPTIQFLIFRIFLRKRW